MPEQEDALQPGRGEGNPILVTGSHRSGTTWLANMLSLADGTLMAHEPFNIEPWAYSLGGLAEHWFAYAPGLPQDAALEAFGAVLDRRARRAFLKSQWQHWLPPLRRGRLVIKDPIAALSSEWLARNHDLEVVVVVRHPLAFAASLKRLGWTRPFGHFLVQERLMEDHLGPYRAEIEDAPRDVVGQAALLWKCLYGTLSTYLARNPGWHVRSHEELSADPAGGLRGLYQALGLEWTAGVQDGVARHTRSGNPVSAPRGRVHQLRRDSAASVSQWKGILTAGEVARVQQMTRPVSGLYYPDEPRGSPLRHLAAR
jgi:hypothetical protein